MKTTHSMQSNLKSSFAHIPEIGGIEYWLFIIAMGFLVFVGSGILVIASLGWLLEYNALWVGAVVASLITLKFIQYKHRQFTQMSAKEYRRYFLKRSLHSPFVQDNYHNGYLKIDSPLDPSSSSYWTMGAGSLPYRREMQSPFDITNPSYWTTGHGGKMRNGWD